MGNSASQKVFSCFEGAEEERNHKRLVVNKKKLKNVPKLSLESNQFYSKRACATPKFSEEDSKYTY